MNDEMITRYIFKHMRITESRLDAMSKAIIKQMKLNKGAKWLVLVMILSQAVQYKQIEALKQEIEELKHPEGE